MVKATLSTIQNRQPPPRHPLPPPPPNTMIPDSSFGRGRFRSFCPFASLMCDGARPRETAEEGSPPSRTLPLLRPLPGSLLPSFVPPRVAVARRLPTTRDRLRCSYSDLTTRVLRSLRSCALLRYAEGPGPEDPGPSALENRLGQCPTRPRPSGCANRTWQDPG